jgi:cyclomaltodextrinase / maltogenic alpha-amylase / neopullulanase
MKTYLLLISFFCAASATAQDYFPSASDLEWSKKVVWYQIFPERFRNGDTDNDPQLNDIKGSYPNDETSPWQLHPWGADWYKLQNYEQQNGKDIWSNLQRRRYGGDLQGVIDKLDYLKDLGINALYLNPIFTSPSLHKYDATGYHHVDPTFGPDPTGDRITMATEIPDDPKTWRWTKADKLALKLIKEAHKRGMYIIFDGVFNHLGKTSWAFKDLEQNQANSRFKNWFDVETFADASKGIPFKYKGWWGVPELPEIKEDANGIVSGPKQYIFACTQRWMDPDADGSPNDGIDGWRLDVAFCVAHPFWKDWHKFVRKINQNAYTTAEVIDNLDVIKPYVVPDEFTALMNYNFSFFSSAFFISDKYRIKNSQFDSLLLTLQNGLGYDTFLKMQNLYDSHDTDRLGSRIVNRNLVSYLNWQKYFDMSHGSDATYNTRKPNLAEHRLQMLMVTFQMTYPGAPMIYYGDEVGAWGATDPDCRKPMIWADRSYEVEQTTPKQTESKSPAPVEIETSLFAHYKKVIAIRRKYEALQLGDYKTVFIDDARSMYGFARSYNRQKIIVLINNNDKPQGATLDLPTAANYIDLLTEAKYDAPTEEADAARVDSRVFVLKAKSAMILLEQ